MKLFGIAGFDLRAKAAITVRVIRQQQADRTKSEMLPDTNRRRVDLMIIHERPVATLKVMDGDP